MSKGIKIFGIVASIAMIAVGIFLPVPDRTINTWASVSDGGYEEYVGGDAYNIQIEASIRGGIIAGRTVAKAVLISIGILILFLSLALSSKENSENNVVYVRSQENQNTTPDTAKPNPPLAHNTGEIWICPDCGESNPDTQRVCKGCGYNK